MQPTLTAFQREVHLRGGAVQWSTDILRPGRQPGMAGPDALAGVFSGVGVMTWALVMGVAVVIGLGHGS